MNKQIVYVAGLPRAGSTLICQLLGMHKDIYSTGLTSPLPNIIETIRQSLSNNNYHLSQFDVDFDLVYRRLFSSYRGFINGWFEETDKPIVVDKNRAWVSMLQTLFELDPDYKIILCVRDLVQLYGSIDDQHRKTILVSYSDPLTTNSSWYRADQAYSPSGVVGGPLRALENLQDIDGYYLADKRIYFLKYEELVTNTSKELDKIATFLNISSFDIDLQNLEVKKHESDSHYRYKFRHNTYGSMKPIKLHKVPIRIATEIVQKFSWYFDYFYPGIYTELKTKQIPKTSFGSQRQGDNNGPA